MKNKGLSSEPKEFELRNSCDIPAMLGIFENEIFFLFSSLSELSEFNKK